MVDTTYCHVTLDGDCFCCVAGLAEEVVEEEYGGDRGEREDGVMMVDYLP